MDERRLMHVARDHHRRLIARDPLHEIDVAEEALAAPTGRRIRRRGMMPPDPSSRPLRGGFLQPILKALLDLWPVPPRADREQRVADGQAVAVAGDPELADLADPARDFFALRAALVEIMVARAEDHFGDP